MSFPVVLASAVAATLALVSVAVFLPAYIGPSVAVAGAAALAPILLPYLKRRAAEHRRHRARGRPRTR